MACDWVVVDEEAGEEYEAVYQRLMRGEPTSLRTTGDPTIPTYGPHPDVW